MPTYVYRRADGTTFEEFQSITAAALTVCPTTNQPVERVISGGTGFILKGSGFYQTDYVTRPNGEDSAKETKSEEQKADTDKKPESKKKTAVTEEPD